MLNDPQTNSKRMKIYLICNRVERGINESMFNLCAAIFLICSTIASWLVCFFYPCSGGFIHWLLYPFDINVLDGFMESNSWLSFASCLTPNLTNFRKWSENEKLERGRKRRQRQGSNAYAWFSTESTLHFVYFPIQLIFQFTSFCDVLKFRGWHTRCYAIKYKKGGREKKVIIMILLTRQMNFLPEKPWRD